MAADNQSSKATRLRVLHIVAEIREQAMAYYEFVAGMADRNDLSVVSLHTAELHLPSGVTAFEGDGTLRGLFRALSAALRRHYDLYHVHFPNVSAPFLLAAIWRPGIMARTIFTFHTTFADLSARNRVLFFFVLCFFRRIVCCSRSSMMSIPPLLRRLAGNRLTYIRNGVNIERIEELRGRTARKAGTAPMLMTACRLVAVKDVRTLLEAFRLTGDPALRLAVVGDGPERAALTQFCAQAGIAERVDFTGAVGRDSVYERMLASDSFIATSLREGIGLAVMEAMACGLPVILSDIEPFREIAGGSSAVAFAPPGDAAGFAREIVRLFALPEARRKEIGEEGRRIVFERFRLSDMQEAYLRLYAEVAGNLADPEQARRLNLF